MNALKYLSREYGICDEAGKNYFLDYLIRTKNGQYAIEENGVTYHHPQIIGEEKYRNQLHKQNTCMLWGIKLFRFSSEDCAFENRIEDDIKQFLGKDASNFVADGLKIDRTVELYEHQTISLQEIQKRRSAGVKAFLIVLPTASGKSKIVEEDLRIFANDKPDFHALILVPGINILLDWRERVKMSLPELVDHIEIRTYAYMARHYTEMPSDYYNYLVVDEAHHAVAPILKRVIQYYDTDFTVGLTATDQRPDKKKLETVFGTYSTSLSLKEAMKKEIVAKANVYRIETNIDLSKVRFNGKDYVNADLEKRIRVTSRNELIVNVLKEYFLEGEAGKRQGVIFCVNVAHANEMARLFGTDGVRGVANRELTPLLAMQLGQAGAYVLTKEKAHKPTIMVGCDTRISGDMLANALMAGACSVGANCVYVGVIPTPAVAYLTQKYRVDAGVVISASHNPVEFNGIKFFDGNGYKLPDAMEDEIEELIRNQMPGIKFPTGAGVGKIKYRTDAREEYINHAICSVPVDLSGLKIVVDCAEGASCYTSVETLKELGGNIVAIHNNPDGTNINANCGSTHMEELQERVVYEKANVGLAFDGDADRLLAVDENGKIVDGDQIMAIVGNYMKSQGKLKKDTIVATIMSNLGFFLMGEKNHLVMEQTKVGDRYVLERMKEIGASLGGEQSGHIIFLDENTTGDGLLSALHLLQVMVDTGKPLSELAGIMEVLPQALVNAKVANNKKDKYLEYPQIAEAIAELEKKFAGEGRVLIRPSGTEPLVRVMIEGKNQQEIQQEAEKLAELIQDVMF